MALVIAMVAGYLIGSVSFAVLVSRSLGLDDPRSYGSGNPGATNVLRSGNRKAALLTLVGDTLKGAVAVWLARALAGVLGLDPLGVMLVGAAAFVGHLYPVFHRFAGGKGVATAAGVLLAIAPWHGLAVVSTWLIIAYFFRYSSLAALVSVDQQRLERQKPAGDVDRHRLACAERRDPADPVPGDAFGQLGRRRSDGLAADLARQLLERDRAIAVHHDQPLAAPVVDHHQRLCDPVLVDAKLAAGLCRSAMIDVVVAMLAPAHAGTLESAGRGSRRHRMAPAG